MTLRLIWPLGPTEVRAAWIYVWSSKATRFMQHACGQQSGHIPRETAAFMVVSLVLSWGRRSIRSSAMMATHKHGFNSTLPLGYLIFL